MERNSATWFDSSLNSFLLIKYPKHLLASHYLGCYKTKTYGI